MEPASFSEELRRYLALLLRWYWLLILSTVLFGAAAFLYSVRTTPVYQAVTTLLVNEAPIAKTTDYTSILTSERLARTYAEMLTKKPVLDAVIERTGLVGMTSSDLQRAMQVELIRDTQLVEVKVEHIHPELAAELANTIVEIFSEQNIQLNTSRYAASIQNLLDQLSEMDAQIQEETQALEALGDNPEDEAERERLETILTQYRQTYAYLLQAYEQVRVAEASSTSNVVQIEPAVPPASPIRPRVLFNSLLAALVGLVLSAGAAFLIDTLDDTIKSPDEISRILGLPVLGLIASHSIDDGCPIVLAQPRSPVAEAFRSLRTNIQFASVDRSLSTILVTSPSPSEGKSTVAANLGAVLAQGGRRVAVVDADLRCPRVHEKFGLPNRSGMSSLFVRPVEELNGALQNTSFDGLYAITSGELPPNPAELLGSEKMVDILNETRRKVDLVVIDSPPLMAVTDAAVLAPRVDGVLLVIKPGATKLALVRHAVEQLQRVGARLLGVVLNEVELKRSRYYRYEGYYYAYQDYYSQESGGRQKGSGDKGKAGAHTE